MIKLNPIDELKARLQYLIETKNVDLSTIVEFDYLYLKNKIYNYCEQTFNKEELITATNELFKDQINSVHNKIDSISFNAKKLLPFGHKGELLNAFGGVQVTPIERERLKDHLSKELNAYILMIGTINQTRNEQKEIPVGNQKKAGRKPIKVDFLGFPVEEPVSGNIIDPTISKFNDITEEQCRELYYLTLTGETRNKQLINPKSSTGDEKFLFRLFTQPAVELKKNGEAKIYFDCEIAYISFVFYWLQVKKNYKNAFTSLEKTKIFYNANGKLITQNDLSSAKTTFEGKHGIKFDEIINSKGKKATPEEIDSSVSEKEILEFINSKLTSLFRVK